MRKAIAITGAAAILAIGATSAFAADHEVKMLNRGADGIMVFEPALVQIEPGDTVHFLATDRGHNVETIDGMIPDGFEPFRSAISKDFSITFDKEGLYGVKCTPHLAMGMVGLIVVGDPPASVEQAEGVRLPRKAQERFDAIFVSLE